MSVDVSRSPVTSSRPWHRWLWVPAMVAAMLGTFLAVGVLGARAAARDERVLAALDTAVEGIRASGTALYTWLPEHSTVISQAATACATVIALLGLAVGRRRGAPLVVLAAGGSLVVWAQFLLLQDRIALGADLYGASILCALGLGIWYPMKRLDGFPRPQFVPDAPAATASRALPLGCECALVFLLTVMALLTRTYALTELPASSTFEMIISMVASRTMYGIWFYGPDSLRTNSPGMMHLFPQFALFHLLGTSLFTLRFSAVFWGVLAVPLLYWLARRMAGTAAAMAATLLFVAAPEQLYWSRIEEGSFIPVAVLALVTVHLGLWMVRRFSLAAVLAAALWTPFCRFFYAAAMVMFVFPSLLYAHALLFVRGAWRKAWYVVPLLAGGVLLWFYSLTILFAALNGRWQFIHPTNMYGAWAWREHGGGGGGALQALRVQATTAAHQFAAVVAAFTHHEGFSQWYDRKDLWPNHATMIDAGVTALVIPGLGYLLAQIYDPRAFALLLWIGVGLLPGVLSNDPSDRRIALIFPALYIVAGVMLAFAVRLGRACGGRVVAGLTAAVLSVVVAGTMWTSLASHFLVPTGRLLFDDSIRFVQPLYAPGDLILHDIEHGRAMILTLGNLDDFLKDDATPGFQFVDRKDWISMALRPRCDFGHNAYRFTMPPQQVNALRETYRPQHISFLFEDSPYDRNAIELVRQLYPDAAFQAYKSPTGLIQLLKATVDLAQVDALHALSLRMDPQQGPAAALATGLLAGVKLQPAPAQEGTSGIVVRGGLLLERDGWYRFALGPPCPQASVAIDDKPAGDGMQPLAAGVHAFELTLPSPGACTLPLRLLMQPHDQKTPAPVPPGMFVSEAVVSSPLARAQPLTAYAGYGDARYFVDQPRPLDFDIDAAGQVTALFRDDERWSIRRFGADGRETASWTPRLPEGQRDVTSLTVDAAGNVLLMFPDAGSLYDPSGTVLSVWKTPSVWTLGIAFWHDGRLLSPAPHRNAIAIVNRDGTLEREWSVFEGGPGAFHSPTSITVGAQGDILVVEEDGHALVFRNPTEDFAPQFVASFRIDFGQLPVRLRGAAFDGSERMLIPDSLAGAPLVFNTKGERMAAAIPERDLSKTFREVVKFRSQGDRLLVLDGARQMWTVERQPDAAAPPQRNGISG